MPDVPADSGACSELSREHMASCARCAGRQRCLQRVEQRTFRVWEQNTYQLLARQDSGLSTPVSHSPLLSRPPPHRLPHTSTVELISWLSPAAPAIAPRDIPPFFTASGLTIESSSFGWSRYGLLNPADLGDIFDACGLYTCSERQWKVKERQWNVNEKAVEGQGMAVERQWKAKERQ